MLVGAFVAAFKIDNWTSFYYNIIPILLFVIVCFTCKANIQVSLSVSHVIVLVVNEEHRKNVRWAVSKLNVSKVVVLIGCEIKYVFLQFIKYSVMIFASEIKIQ